MSQKLSCYEENTMVILNTLLETTDPEDFRSGLIALTRIVANLKTQADRTAKQRGSQWITNFLNQWHCRKAILREKMFGKA
jgi:hypothetical protein